MRLSPALSLHGQSMPTTAMAHRANIYELLADLEEDGDHELQAQFTGNTSSANPTNAPGLAGGCNSHSSTPFRLEHWSSACKRREHLAINHEGSLQIFRPTPETTQTSEQDT